MLPQRHYNTIQIQSCPTADKDIQAVRKLMNTFILKSAGDQVVLRNDYSMIDKIKQDNNVKSL